MIYPQIHHIFVSFYQAILGQAQSTQRVPFQGVSACVVDDELGFEALYCCWDLF